MASNILLAATAEPEECASGATSYRLFEHMQRTGRNVAWVDLIREPLTAPLRASPCREGPLPQTYACVISPPTGQVEPALSDAIRRFNADLLVGCGALATVLLHAAAPQCPVVLLADRCERLQMLVHTGAVRDFMQFERRVRRGVNYASFEPTLESQAAGASTVIFTPSPLMRFAFEHLYPQHVGELYAVPVSPAALVYAEAEACRALARPFAERDVDVVFPAGARTPIATNDGLTRRIVEACTDLTVRSAGTTGAAYRAPTDHGLASQRQDLYALLGRSKTFVCPSRLDAGPHILFAASAMGCNVVASPNCGNWPLCHTDLVAPQCTRGAFLDKIRLSLARPYSDNRDVFLNGCADLLETLDVL
jgi:hypothetical protein